MRDESVDYSYRWVKVLRTVSLNTKSSFPSLIVYAISAPGPKMFIFEKLNLSELLSVELLLRCYADQPTLLRLEYDSI